MNFRLRRATGKEILAILSPRSSTPFMETALENFARSESFVIKNSGYCHCCRQNTIFSAKYHWFRDHYVCGKCGSIPRLRHLHYVLDSFFPGWEGKKIHESSPSGGTIPILAKDYSYSHFFPHIPPGQIHEGVRCENIERLTFENESFDIFITQDVIEHVFRPDLAVKDICRVLKPGGFHIFSAPKHKGLTASIQRARLESSGEVKHLLEPSYHGNPIGDGKALVTWDYGHDFERLLGEWSGSTVQVFHTIDREKGIDAEFNEIFVIRKA